LVVLAAGAVAVPLPAAAKPEPPLRFATYNVCKTSCGTGEFAWQKRRHAVIRTIRSAAPDVLALQEVDNSYRWITRRLAGHGYAMVQAASDDCVDGAACVDDSRLYYRTNRVQPLVTQIPSEPISQPCRAYISEDGQLPVEPTEPDVPPAPSRSGFPSRAQYQAARAAWTQQYQQLRDSYSSALSAYAATMAQYAQVNARFNCDRFVGRTPFTTHGSGNTSLATIGKNSLEDAVSNRNFSWAVFSDLRTGGAFVAASIHLPNEKTALAERYRKHLARELVSYLRATTDATDLSKAPTLLLGDFNSYWQRQPRGVQWILGRAGFTDAISARLRVNENVPTINLTRTARDPFPARPFRFDSPARLDYVMFDRGKALRYEVHLRLRDDGRFDNRFRGSDHNLVLADVRLPRVSAPDRWTAASG
jgi:endonuclease/exonuclease/phosphatase family metal-dependent hydrolase